VQWSCHSMFFCESFSYIALSSVKCFSTGCFQLCMHWYGKTFLFVNVLIFKICLFALHYYEYRAWSTNVLLMTLTQKWALAACFLRYIHIYEFWHIQRGCFEIALTLFLFWITLTLFLKSLIILFTFFFWRYVMLIYSSVRQNASDDNFIRT